MGDQLADKTAMVRARNRARRLADMAEAQRQAEDRNRRLGAAAPRGVAAVHQGKQP